VLSALMEISMRYIPATDVFVEKLKQQAKKLKRSKAIKQAEALDRVARTYGFNHWGHVTWCLKEAAARQLQGCSAKADFIDPAKLSFTSEIEYIIGCALKRSCTMVRLKSCILFSSDDGDAWLLDADDNRALCLAWRGERQSFTITEDEKTFYVEYDAVFDVTDLAFRVASDNPKIAKRTIFGYPTEDIAELVDSVRRSLIC
jgi:hypothetical protein